MSIAIQLPLTELLKRYAAEHEYGIKANTMDCWYKPAISSLRRHLGHEPELADLRTATINGWIDRMRETLAENTAKTRRQAVLTLWKYAAEEDLVEPPKKIRKIRLAGKNPKAWSPAEVWRLIQAAQSSSRCNKKRLGSEIPHGVYFASLIAAGFDSALRLGDLFALSPGDLIRVEDGAQIVKTMSKTGRVIRCWLSAETLALIDQCLACEPTARETIWPIPTHKGQFWKQIRFLVREAGVTPGTFRFIRRAAITAAEAMRPGSGSTLAGHSSRATTVRHYIDATKLRAGNVKLPSVVVKPDEAPITAPQSVPGQTGKAEQIAPLSVADGVGMYLSWFRASRARTSLEKHARTLDSFVEMFGPMQVSDVKPRHAAQWIESHSVGCGTTTVNDRLTTLQGCFAWLEKQGYLRAPLRLKKPKPEPKSSAGDSFLPFERWEELIEAAGKPVQPLVRFLLFTGAMPQEALALRKHHWTGESFTIPADEYPGRPKERTINVPAWMMGEVSALVASRKKGQHVFLNARGEPWTKDAINCAFLRLRKKLGEPHLCATSLRRSFAADKIRRGCPLEVVSRLMGYRSVSQLLEQCGRAAPQPERIIDVLEATPMIAPLDGSREIVEAYLAGETLVSIGKRHGKTSEAVRKVLIRAGIDRRQKGPTAGSEPVLLRFESGTKGVTDHRPLIDRLRVRADQLKAAIEPARARVTSAKANSPAIVIADAEDALERSEAAYRSLCEAIDSVLASVESEMAAFVLCNARKEGT